MNHLLRSTRRSSDAGWQQLDDEARQRLVPALAARKLVDFSGPLGWEHSATNLGRTTAARTAPVDGLQARQRRVLPLVELRADFTVARDELLDADRGAADLDLAEPRRGGPPDRPGREHRRLPRLGGGRASPASPSRHRTSPSPSATAYADYPSRVARAVEMLLEQRDRAAPTVWRSARRATPGSSRRPSTAGCVVFDHLRQILGGPIVWSPGVRGRGGRQPSRRRLPLRVRARTCRSATTTTTPTSSTSTSRRASASGSPRPTPRSRCIPRRGAEIR